MPHKGIFSQGLVVLLSDSAALDEVENLLTEFGPPTRKPTFEDWEFSGPAIVLPYRPDVNGYVSVDLVERPWPDDMGNPKEKPILFGAWSMGHFGPCTFPGNLSRAVQQSWSWPAAKELVPRHKAFVRVRSSYIFGAGPQAKCLPADYAPLPELQFLTAIIKALLENPNALAYFNPGGEVLMGASELNAATTFAKSHSLPPLDV